VNADSLEMAVRELAVAAHPHIYEPAPWASELGHSITPGLHVPDDHPAAQRFGELASETEPFATLYAAGAEGAFLSFSSGTGWRLQPQLVPTAIVGSAAREVLYLGGDVDSADELADQASDVLRRFGELLGGEEVEIATLVAFSGVALEAGMEMDLPWGSARNASDFERELQPFGGGKPASLVVQAPLRASLRVGEPEDEPNYDPTALQRVLRSTSLLPLALLLAVEREAYVTAEFRWQTSLYPASLGSAYSSGNTESTWMDRFVQPSVLSGEEQERVVAWTATVNERHDPSIDVAIRRGLSAVRERVNIEDALIDAVIAMENLFGHGEETEVTFRVTSAIAILLEDPERRAAFRTRLGKIYGSRSKVVHGGIVDAGRLHEHKEEAIKVMISCFRALFERMPHLLSEQERGIRLILGSDNEA
jgi:hypothetical protein